MSDIFGRATDVYGASFSADGAVVTFSEDLGVGGAIGQQGNATQTGLLLQNLTATYQQNILHLYEIGSLFHFLVAGRTQGQMALARVLGPRRISLAFYSKFGNVCNAATNNIFVSFLAGCGPANLGQSMQLAMKFCVIANMGVSMNAENSLISENLSLMFCSLLMALGNVQQVNAVGPNPAGPPPPIAPAVK